MTKIKICGLFRPCDIDFVNEARPDWCGFIISFPRSHRNQTPDQVRALRARLEKDVRAGLRRPDVIGRSLAYLPLYAALDTEKLDVSLITPEEAAEGILLGGLR